MVSSQQRCQRAQLLQRVADAGAAGGSGQGDGCNAAADECGVAAASAAPPEERGSPLFRGYSRELLRMRQVLTRGGEHAGSSDRVAKATVMLEALARRATTEASALRPPPLPPGVTTLSEDDPTHAQYLLSLIHI